MSDTLNVPTPPINRRIQRYEAAINRLTIANVHSQTDHAADVARVRRVAADESALLTDALHALRNGSPNVTEEFLERTIVALRRVRDRRATTCDCGDCAVE